MYDERWTSGNSEAFLQLTASSAGVASWEGAWDGAPGPGRHFVQTFPRGDVLCFFRLPVFASNALVIGKEGARLAGNFRETTKNSGATGRSISHFYLLRLALGVADVFSQGHWSHVRPLAGLVRSAVRSGLGAGLARLVLSLTSFVTTAPGLIFFIREN